MSYILDALKKAAEQRDAHVPAMRRLLSPAPDDEESPRWRMALIGAAAAFAGGVATVWVLWPATPVATVVPVTAPAATAAPAEPPAAVQPPPPPTPPVVRTTPAKPAPVAKTPSEKVRAPEKPAAVARAVPERVPAADSPAPIVRAPIVDSQRPAEILPAPPPRTATAPPPAVAAARPTPPAAPAAPPAPKSELSSPVRLEVIVYAEERSRRLAFINGKKYLEGDTILENARIQEIQPNAVVIVEDGRRVVLRP